MTLRSFLCITITAASLQAQALDPNELLHPDPSTWPTYNGDYSGRRFSTLSKINSQNVQSLSLAWVFRTSSATGTLGNVVKSTPLVVDGVAYFTIPDHVFAIDARTGHLIWQHSWSSKGGWHLGNRGVGMYGDWLYFETPDCNLVALNSKDGSERWHKQICDLDRFYTATVAPVVIGNHVIVGVSGDDLDIPGYLESRDPETGDVQWHWSSVPKPGEPGSETWPNAEAMEHGGGMTWVPSTYDPDLKLLYLGTGNPQPVIAGKGSRRRQPVYRIDCRAAYRYRQARMVLSSLRRTTRTIGTPWRRRFFSMANSTAARANCWRKQAVTAITLFSTEPMGSTSRLRSS